MQVQTELKFKRQFESELAKQQFEEKRLLMKENNDRIFQEQRQVIRKAIWTEYIHFLCLSKEVSRAPERDRGEASA